jgi:hypothetical protein
MELPTVSLLHRYRTEGAYTDCFVTDVPLSITQADYVEAFYTTWLFRLERWILSWLARRPSTDIEARELAFAKRDNFAAWSLEARTDNQLLMCDFQGSTRSWLMTEPIEDSDSIRCYFGSAVVPGIDRNTGEKRLGAVYRLLMGFHKRYSRALLSTAKKRLLSRAQMR